MLIQKGDYLVLYLELNLTSDRVNWFMINFALLWQGHNPNLVDWLVQILWYSYLVASVYLEWKIFKLRVKVVSSTLLERFFLVFSSTVNLLHSLTVALLVSLSATPALWFLVESLLKMKLHKLSFDLGYKGLLLNHRVVVLFHEYTQVTCYWTLHISFPLNASVMDFLDSLFTLFEELLIGALWLLDRSKRDPELIFLDYYHGFIFDAAVFLVLNWQVSELAKTLWTHLASLVEV
jgi:hypothetical protein